MIKILLFVITLLKNIGFCFGVFFILSETNNDKVSLSTDGDA